MPMAVPTRSRAQQPRMRSLAERPPPLAQTHENDRGAAELRALDCNLAALCEHIQVEGFNSGAFSDVVVLAMDSTYHLHRLVLSRSSYFRNMLHGPWKEAGAPTLTLNIDDENVNSEAIAAALAYLYGHHPKLNGNNACRILAAASFLDLQELCAICTDFIISELWASNFLSYQVFAESQDYGTHGERVRNACWGYLCQSGAVELREVLPRLSSQTLHALLTSDELWVPNEEKRFELAIYALLAKSTFSKRNLSDKTSLTCESTKGSSDSALLMGERTSDLGTSRRNVGSELQHMSLQDNLEHHKAAQNVSVDLSDRVVVTDVSYGTSTPFVQTSPSTSRLNPRYSGKVEDFASLGNSFSCSDSLRVSYCHMEAQSSVETNKTSRDHSSAEGPPDDPCYSFSNIWVPREESTSSSSVSISNDDGDPTLWDAKKVCKKQVKIMKRTFTTLGEEDAAFMNIFEGDSLLYCHMSFEALLRVRKQLEELGFPCKAVNDGLWLQVLVSHRLQEIALDTCINCCLTSIQCTCPQPYGYTHGSIGYFWQEQSRSNSPHAMGNVYISESQGEGNGLFGPVRVHVRGPIDGLAGIGRGTTFVAGAACPPTRLVFSRVPLGTGNRNYQHSVANDESETRVDMNGDLTGDGLTALVGLSRGNNSLSVPAEQSDTYETDFQNRLPAASSLPNASGSSMQMLESQENDLGLDWDDSDTSTVSWDLKTPLRHFPPFRFGVEFEDVHRLADGQVKHSVEVFYAGSLWKVSVQAFNNEYPQGRRTLGLFLHRRKAEATESLKNVRMYVDSREKVTARYQVGDGGGFPLGLFISVQLICPSKREVMVFGNFKDSGTLLPKAPKGWGWRTALLFDELPDLLQGGALRVVAVVQIV